MRIPESKIEEIIQSTDIISLISGYVSLKGRGRNHVGLCPFHTEKTPSFTVSADKNIWHCFGCGEGGNALHFLMKIENMPFIDAVKNLAERCGVKLDFEKTEKDGEYEKKIKIMEEAAVFYQNNLLTQPAGRHALNYLYKRGVTLEVIKKFRIGLSLDGYDKLVKHLEGKKFPLEDVSKLGLARKSEKNKNYADYFRARVMFPIFNYKGAVIAFGGRILSDIQPKFLNSPDTEVFSKRKNLYLFNFAKSEIGKKKYAIVVEGYFDAVIMHQYGFTNTVASLGTSLTKEQAELIARYSKNIVLAMDPDEAGEKAVDRAIEIFEDAGLNVKVLILPKGFDPDLFLREKGAQEFKKKLAKSINIIDFKMFLGSKKYKLNTPEGKVDFIREVMISIKNIKEPVKADEYIKKIAGFVNVREELVRSYYKGGENISRAHAVRWFKVPELEERLIYFVLFNPAYIDKISLELENNFEGLKFSELFKIISGKKFKNEKELIDFINFKVKDENILSAVTKISLQENIEPVTDEFVEGVLKKIKDERLKILFEKLQLEVAELVNKGEIDNSSEKFNEYQKLVKYFRGGKP